jgi:hypothetical protein
MSALTIAVQSPVVAGILSGIDLFYGVGGVGDIDACKCLAAAAMCVFCSVYAVHVPQFLLSCNSVCDR